MPGEPTGQKIYRGRSPVATSGERLGGEDGGVWARSVNCCIRMAGYLMSHARRRVFCPKLNSVENRRPWDEND